MPQLTEEDVKNRLITPALRQAGWAPEQMLMEHRITPGQMIVQGGPGPARQ